MKFMKTPIILAMCSTFALGACTDPSLLGNNPGDPNRNTKQGALLGAASGALLGALVSKDGKRGDRALAGALVGGAVGAGVGYGLDQQEADLRRDLGNAKVSIQNTGDRLIVTLPQDILFAKDSFAVRSDLTRDLNTVASNLQAYPNSTIQIVGHTDSDGDETADCVDTDVDGDGFTNIEETQCGSDPINPESKCRRGLPFLMLLLD